MQHVVFTMLLRHLPYAAFTNLTFMVPCIVNVQGGPKLGIQYIVYNYCIRTFGPSCSWQLTQASGSSKQA